MPDIASIFTRIFGFIGTMPFIRTKIREGKKNRYLVKNYRDKEKKKLKADSDSVSRCGHRSRGKQETHISFS